MNDRELTQEEINALIASENIGNKEFILTEEQKDVIGEVGNISMSTAATTLSQVIGKKVLITTPKVKCITFEELIEYYSGDNIVTSIKFKEGLDGENLLIMDVEDGLVIADLMMGGDGTNTEKELSELELSALAEAMNQMIGSSATSMSMMLKRGIDIEPPIVKLLSKEDMTEDNLNLESPICAVAFDLSVEGLRESEIMQVFDKDTVSEIINVMLEDALIKTEDATDADEKEIIEEKVEISLKEKDSVVEEEKVKVQTPVFSELSQPEGRLNNNANLDLIMDVPLEFSVVLGKNKKTIKEILSFTSGSIVELDKLADEPLEIYVNGKLIASGEVVVINENFGVRITNILTKEERVKYLG